MTIETTAAPVSDSDLDRYALLDRRMVLAVQDIRILATVAWPASIGRDFLGSATPRSLPRIAYVRPNLSAARAELAAIEDDAGDGNPMSEYFRRSAQSWAVAAQMLEAVGTDAVSGLSALLYGKPTDLLRGSTSTALDAARHFVAIADELGGDLALGAQAYCIPADTLREELQHQLDAFFGAGTIAIEVDPALTAKAAAGARRIRLRAATCFSEYDRHQLLAHEAFVHSLTALNGRAQPWFKSLSRAAPRVTATQEGLAVFAELMSGSIDIARLTRISLRILAIDMALNGADFVEVFRFFVAQGQAPEDSFASAQRIFRGVPVSGGAAFAKDVVYLRGLLSVHTFFRWALRERRLDLLRNLFAGKLALDDVFALEPCFKRGIIAGPRYLPPWVQQVHGLAGKLAFSLFANEIRVDQIGVEDFLLEP